MHSKLDENLLLSDLSVLQFFTLKKLLNLNQENLHPSTTSSQDDTHSNDDGYIWKVLIYDKFCSNVLSTLFKVGNFWNENVTLHLGIQSNREKLYGIKVLYFVQPTDDNVKRIIEDFSKDLYDSVYINFSYPIEADKLQNMAKSLSKYNCLHKIRQVYQHYLNYITLTPTLFEINLSQSYSILNSTDNKEKPKYLDQIAYFPIS